MDSGTADRERPHRRGGGETSGGEGEIGLPRPPAAHPRGRLTPRFAWGLLAAILLAASPYVGVVGTGFLGDDFGRVGAAARSQDHPLAFVRESVFAERMEGTPYYRPAYATSYLVDLALFGLCPAGFHAVDIALHIGTSLVVALLAARLWKNRRAALLAGVLFAASPVHVEAVAWIAGRDDQMSVLFGASAVLLVAYPARARWRLAARAAAAIAFAVALSSKESAVVVPAVAFLVASIRPDSPFTEGHRSTIRRGLAAIWPMLAVLVAVAALRLLVLPGVASPKIADVPPPDPLSGAYWWDRLEFLRLLVAPVRGDAHGAVLTAAVAATSGLLLAMAATARPARRIVGALSAWLALSLAPLHWSSVDVETLLDSRHLYALAVPTVLLLSGGVVTNAGRRFDSLRNAAAALLVATYMALLVENVLVFRDASDVAERMRSEIAAVAAPPRSDGVRVVEELPYAHRGVPVGSMISGLLAPPWLPHRPRTPLALWTRRHRTILVGSYALERAAPTPWRRWLWDDDTRSLVELDRHAAPFVVRGRVGVQPAGLRLRCLDRRIFDVAPRTRADLVEGAQDQVYDLLVRPASDPPMEIVGASPRAPTISIQSRDEGEDRIGVAIRTRPRASVLVLAGVAPDVVPVHQFGSLLIRSPRPVAHGFADSDGDFEASVRLPEGVRHADVVPRLQAVVGDRSGWIEISECVCIDESD